MRLRIHQNLSPDIIKHLSFIKGFRVGEGGIQPLLIRLSSSSETLNTQRKKTDQMTLYSYSYYADLTTMKKNVAYGTKNESLEASSKKKFFFNLTYQVDRKCVLILQGGKRFSSSSEEAKNFFSSSFQQFHV